MRYRRFKKGQGFANEPAHENMAYFYNVLFSVVLVNGTGYQIQQKLQANKQGIAKKTTYASKTNSRKRHTKKGVLEIITILN